MVADRIAGTVERASVWMRWRWDRSHFEAAAMLLVASSALAVTEWVATDRVALRVMLTLNLIGLLLGVLMMVGKARRHNRPANVGEWGWEDRFHVNVQLVFIGMGVVLAVVDGVDPLHVAAVLASLGFIVGSVPGRRVEHDPPASGRLVLEVR